MKRGQSLNDFELNQKPVLINQPYCRTKKSHIEKGQKMNCQT